jgi:hypothetical protein
MTKEYFIQQYTEIHDNLNYLEREIDSHLLNKKDLIGNDEILENLNKRTISEIERLNNTRKHEREIFNY